MLLGVDITYMVTVFPRLLGGVPITLLLLLVSYVLAMLGGALFAAVRIQRIAVLNGLVGLMLSFFRSLPNVLTVLLIYYGVPVLANMLGIQLDWGKVTSCIVSLTLVYSCYFAEYIRPAWQSVPRGLRDAADAIGMSRAQRTRFIVAPLATPVALPSLTNGLIDMLKDTSVLFIIGMPDILGTVHSIISNDYGVKKLEVYLAAGIIYAVMIGVLTLGMKLLERRFGRHHHAEAAA
ncbi:amino acid ABC transporter permease [Carnimonas bestiolae]|uniref:amino acid ABC transporter permease n=1 Tax=Carnimonas bestiolae TaxID=3402172 RepID=UPI003EDC0616